MYEYVGLTTLFILMVVYIWFLVTRGSPISSYELQIEEMDVGDLLAHLFLIPLLICLLSMLWPFVAFSGVVWSLRALVKWKHKK